jgi:hypothetical protein
MAVLVGSATLLRFTPASRAVQAGDGPAPAVTTFGGDWTPPYPIGVNVAARTGSNTLTAYKYAVVSAGRLWGTNAMPPDAVRLVGKGP